ncbi:hypothetical protein N8587_02360 [Akkermansiaceae bacterium]|nr:hypothetical protein [Akkermansiaceae bacterium]MDA7872307.1 hypothetical protein [Akkermansiaceae bacterium]
MSYFEYIGPPAAGKTTKMAEEFRGHINLQCHKKLDSYLQFSKQIYFFFTIYGFEKFKRFAFSIYHLYLIEFSASQLVIDQGLVQIYLSHCSEENFTLDSKRLARILKIIDSKFDNLNFIFLGEDIGLNEINLRLKKRNNHRRNGVDGVFLKSFKGSMRLLKQHIEKY